MAVELKSRQSVEILLNQTWCKGCAICARLCPQGVFVMTSQGKAKPAYEEKCSKCYFCEQHCPDLAIKLAVE
jgi:2-oxoglutarate ferredoxin oxidoreductase subunit delta